MTSTSMAPLPKPESPKTAFSDETSVTYRESPGDSGDQSAMLPRAEAIPENVFSNKGAATYRHLTGRDWVATWFAAALLLIIAGVVISLLLKWILPTPDLNAIKVIDQKEAIEQYKNLSAILTERIDKFFDLTVTKSLLPVFATLIGFLLGKRSSKED